MWLKFKNEQDIVSRCPPYVYLCLCTLRSFSFTLPWLTPVYINESCILPSRKVLLKTKHENSLLPFFASVIFLRKKYFKIVEAVKFDRRSNNALLSCKYVSMSVFIFKCSAIGLIYDVATAFGWNTFPGISHFRLPSPWWAHETSFFGYGIKRNVHLLYYYS